MRKTIAALLSLLMLFGMVHGSAESGRGNLQDRFGDQMLEYDGVRYMQNSRLTIVLFMGIDRHQDHAETAGFRDGGQADFLTLLVFDDNLKTIQSIQINRDTMTEITVLNVMGEVSGTRNAQICLAHAFGDGAEQSCELTVEAVENLLGGIEIDYYYAMNMDGISVLNDAIGGVEVTLEDDFTTFDPAMQKGSTLTLHGKQAEYFLRQRYNVGDQSNLSRQKRQQQYIKNTADVLRTRIGENAAFAKQWFGSIEDYSVTDMNLGRMINLTSLAVEYEILPGIQLDGISSLGSNGFMEFHPDQEALKKLVLDIFYRQADW